MRLAPLTLLLAATLGAPALASNPTIQNGHVQLTYDPFGSCGVRLVEIENLTEGLSVSLDATDLWTVQLAADPDGPGGVPKPPVTVVKSCSAGGAFTLFPPVPTDSFAAQWTSVPVGGGQTMNVVLDVSLVPNEPLVQFDISVTLSAGAHSIFRVLSPRISTPSLSSQATPALDPAEERLSIPTVGGYLTPDPVGKGVSFGPGEASGNPADAWEVHPGQLSMQWFSYYAAPDANGKRTNLFYSCRDTLGHRKAFRMSTPGGSLMWGQYYVPEDHLTTLSYTSTYPVVVGVIEGDWFDAARFYRSWASAQPWAANGAMKDNTDFSLRVKNAHMFGADLMGHCGGETQCGKVTEYANFQSWKDRKNEQKTFFDVNEITMDLVRQWDHNSQFANWGEWSPIRPDFLAVAPSHPEPFAPYFNANKVTTCEEVDFGVPCFDDTADYALLEELEDAPKLITELNCINVIPSGTCAGDMGLKPCDNTDPKQQVQVRRVCQSTTCARDYALFWAQTCRAAGATGFHMDRFTEILDMCYGDHGHPVGGGSHLCQDKRTTAQLIRDTIKATDPEFYLTSESQNEMFIDLVELVAMTVTPQTNADSVFQAPLYDAVYHDYQMTSTPLPVFTSFALELTPFGSFSGRQLYAAGIFAGLAPFAGSEVSPLTMDAVVNDPLYVDYANQAFMIQSFMSVLKRRATRNFVTLGERMRDPATAGLPVYTFPEPAAFPRLVYPYGLDQPAVYVSSYARPDFGANGQAGLLFLNWTDATDDVPTFPSGDPGLPGAGDQSFTYTFVPADVGMTSGSFQVVEVLGTGGTTILHQSLFIPDSGYNFSMTVPERSARFLVFRRPFESTPGIR